jgi:hypothetical protein
MSEVLAERKKFCIFELFYVLNPPTLLHAISYLRLGRDGKLFLQEEKKNTTPDDPHCQGGSRRLMSRNRFPSLGILMRNIQISRRYL